MMFGLDALDEVVRVAACLLGIGLGVYVLRSPAAVGRVMGTAGKARLMRVVAALMVVAGVTGIAATAGVAHGIVG